jgi:hypothetical protein
MATPTQTLQTVPSQVRFRLNKTLQLLIAEKLSQRNITIEKYFLELIEADSAPASLARWRAKSSPEHESVETKIEVRGRKEIAAARVQRVLHLAEQAISDGNISQRLGVSVMTVRRILQEYAQSDHVQRSGPAGRARSRGARFWEQ